MLTALEHSPVLDREENTVEAACAITGASGYVGSRIVTLLARHFQVVPMGRKAGREGIAWQMGDRTIANAFRTHNVHMLVHSAWDSTQTNTSVYWKINVEGSRALIAEAKAAGVERIVFISTISAFKGARSIYGKSKLAVEKLVLDAGGVVIRPGLVWGERAGGMFGSLRKLVRGGSIIPMVGTGLYPQYLVHEEDLAFGVLRTLQGDRWLGRVLTIAQFKPWMLRDLILHIASKEGKQVKLIRVPWRLAYAALKMAEKVGLKPSFRSDSLISMIYCNQNPTFCDHTPLRRFE